MTTPYGLNSHRLFVKMFRLRILATTLSAPNSESSYKGLCKTVQLADPTLNLRKLSHKNRKNIWRYLCER